MRSSTKRIGNYFLSKKSIGLDLAICLICLLIISGIGSFFYRLGLDETTIILLYLLGVMIVSILTAYRFCGTFFSLVSVLAYNYLFTEPRFTFHAYGINHATTLLIMLVTSFIASFLAIQLKNYAHAFSQDAYSAKILFNTSQQLSKAKDSVQIYWTTARQLQDLFDCGVVLYSSIDKEPVKAGTVSQIMLDPDHKKIVEKVFSKGAYGGIQEGKESFYAPIHLDATVYGVVGLHKDHKDIDDFEENIFLSILGECAMALERHQILRERQEALIEAENERLRSDLLRMISHDLRTPLTSIYGNVSNLLKQENKLEPSTKKQIYTDIYDDSRWLIQLVENLLAITRLDQHTVELSIQPDVVEDVVEAAIKRVENHKNGHTIHFVKSDDFHLANMDGQLMVQVIVNLLDNAIKYTPEGSKISVDVQEQKDKIQIIVEDDGPGIPDAMKERIFEMFYTGESTRADAKRSLGLGLALCKSVLQAHHGTISVEDNIPHGSRFVMTLPKAKEDVYEGLDR